VGGGGPVLPRTVAPERRGPVGGSTGGSGRDQLCPARPRPRDPPGRGERAADPDPARPPDRVAEPVVAAGPPDPGAGRDRPRAGDACAAVP
jgi:hypothetical protein